MKRAAVVLNVFAMAAVLALAAVAVLWCDRHAPTRDLSRAASNSLSTASIGVLELIGQPIEAIAFVPEQASLRRALDEFFARYRRHHPAFTLRFSDPRLDPEAARRYGAGLGEIVFVVEERFERITRLDESSVTNALAALARRGDRFIAVLAHNGERRIARAANHDLSRWAEHLETRGLALRETGPEQPLPDNAAAVLIASPASAYSAPERAHIEAYIAGGGNLLWLMEPEQAAALDALAASLGVTRLPGTIVDPVGLTRFRNPAYAVAIDPEVHPLTAGFGDTVALPYAGALLATPNAGWTAAPLLRTGDEAWTETGAFEGNVGFDADDEVRGSLILALALTRPRADGGEQRLVMIGDGDFLSNTYVDNLGNRDFGRRVLEWLAADDALIDIAVAGIADKHLDLVMWQRMTIFFVFAALIPLFLFANGCLHWWRRRRA